MSMSQMILFERGAAELLPVCALAAAMDLLVGDDGTALGLRSVCGLAIAVCVSRAILRLLR